MDPHTSTSTAHDQDRPTHRLPVEILACILNFLFPEPGDSHAGRSKSEMAELYRLRMVSKSWKDLIEGMPALWTYVSTAYPTAVVRDCLRWSKNHFLRIRIFHVFITSAEALIECLRLLQPHSHRWITLCYSTTGGPDVDEAQSRIFLESPAPMLQSIYVNLSAFTSGVEVNLAGGRAQGVKHLTLHDGLLPWSSSLIHGLEELSLMVEETVPVEEILDIFVKSPALRYFELSCEGAEGQNNPTALATRSLDTVAASLKQVVIHITHPHITTRILSEISMPSCESVELSMDLTALGGDLQTLDQAMAQFMPRIRETLSSGGRTTLLVSSESDFEWCSPLKHKGFQFSFGISGTDLERLIEWIRNVSAVLEAPLELEISLTTPHRQTLETLSEWGEVTKLEIPWMEDPSEDEMDEMVSIPNFLGDVRVNPIDGLSWNFPNLRELDVYNAGYHPLEIFGMLNKRYLPDTYVRAMEGLGISIQTPPKIALRVQGSIAGGNATIMMALEKHWGVTSLNQGGLDKSQFTDE
ncbi:hypothetical protein FS837_010723 [Tulasnella sp. UAMH 9824]|nr:hypothetical protein FS837_010723 [Tulasnella sp. UAMH 9824]